MTREVRRLAILDYFWLPPHVISKRNLAFSADAAATSSERSARHLRRPRRHLKGARRQAREAASQSERPAGSPNRQAPFSLARGGAGSPPRSRRAAAGRWGGRWGGRAGGVAGRGARAMLITLCYLYLWARWGPRSAALIRRTVRRLHRSRCSFIFCRCAGAPAPPARQPRRQVPPEERVCLRIGNKVFFTDDTQVPPRAPRAEAWQGGRARRAGKQPWPGAASRVTVATSRRLPRRAPAAMRGHPIPPRCPEGSGGSRGHTAPSPAAVAGGGGGGRRERGAAVARLGAALSLWVRDGVCVSGGSGLVTKKQLV